jgi:hypothetical protein
LEGEGGRLWNAISKGKELPWKNEVGLVRRGFPQTSCNLSNFSQGLKKLYAIQNINKLEIYQRNLYAILIANKFMKLIFIQRSIKCCLGPALRDGSPLHIIISQKILLFNKKFWQELITYIPFTVI